MIIPRFSHSLSVQCRFEKNNVVFVEILEHVIMRKDKNEEI